MTRSRAPSRYEELVSGTGVVHDKPYLPGFRKLKRLIDSGFFGRILSVRGEFGYWVFEGDWQAAQRPSWNYRSEDGGGIVVDMSPHWRRAREPVRPGSRARLVQRLGECSGDRVHDRGRVVVGARLGSRRACTDGRWGRRDAWCVRGAVPRAVRVPSMVLGPDDH